MGLVRSVSEKIDRRASREGIQLGKIDGLSHEELEDMGRVVALADFLLCKYEDRKETKEMLGSFVRIIGDACESIGEVDDEIAEMLAAAEDSISRVRELHAGISDRSDLGKGPAQERGGAGLVQII